MYADGEWWAFSLGFYVSPSSSSINHFFFSSLRIPSSSSSLSLVLCLFNVSRLLHGNSSWLTVTQINLSASSLSCQRDRLLEIGVMIWVSESWEDRVLGRLKRRAKWTRNQSINQSISARTIMRGEGEKRTKEGSWRTNFAFPGRKEKQAMSTPKPLSPNLNQQSFLLCVLVLIVSCFAYPNWSSRKKKFRGQLIRSKGFLLEYWHTSNRASSRWIHSTIFSGNSVVWRRKTTALLFLPTSFQSKSNVWKFRRRI